MPREGGRNFPDAAQLGIGALTVLAQSRVTFTGAEGLVMVYFRVRLANAAAVAVPDVTLGVSGSAFPGPGFQGQSHSEAVAGRVMSLHSMFLFRNPTPGSFIEATVATTGGTVDVIVNAGSMVLMSWDAQDLGGPVASVE